MDVGVCYSFTGTRFPCYISLSTINWASCNGNLFGTNRTKKWARNWQSEGRDLQCGYLPQPPTSRCQVESSVVTRQSSHVSRHKSHVTIESSQLETSLVTRRHVTRDDSSCDDSSHTSQTMCTRCKWLTSQMACTRRKWFAHVANAVHTSQTIDVADHIANDRKWPQMTSQIIANDSYFNDVANNRKWFLSFASFATCANQNPPYSKKCANHLRHWRSVQIVTKCANHLRHLRQKCANHLRHLRSVQIICVICVTSDSRHLTSQIIANDLHTRMIGTRRKWFACEVTHFVLSLDKWVSRLAWHVIVLVSLEMSRDVLRRPSLAPQVRRVQ